MQTGWLNGRYGPMGQHHLRKVFKDAVAGNLDSNIQHNFRTTTRTWRVSPPTHGSVTFSDECSPFILKPLHNTKQLQNQQTIFELNDGC